jgi:hypothetical protein
VRQNALIGLTQRMRAPAAARSSNHRATSPVPGAGSPAEAGPDVRPASAPPVRAEMRDRTKAPTGRSSRGAARDARIGPHLRDLRCRVRAAGRLRGAGPMPEPPLLLADRMVGIDATPSPSANPPHPPPGIDRTEVQTSPGAEWYLHDELHHAGRR